MNSPSILVVDDDADLLDVLRRMLESVHYTVVCASDAKSAIAAVTRQAPDIVLTDIYMPKADGFELINWLRTQGLNIPVVAMSGGAMVRYDQLAIAENLGASAVIDKPFRQIQLIETIDRVLANRTPLPR